MLEKEKLADVGNSMVEVAQKVGALIVDIVELVVDGEFEVKEEGEIMFGAIAITLAGVAIATGSSSILGISFGMTTSVSGFLVTYKQALVEGSILK